MDDEQTAGPGDEPTKGDGIGGPATPAQALSALAESSNVTPEVARTAEDYFLGRAAPPDDTFDVEVDFGTLSSPEPLPVKFRALDAAIFERAERYAEKKDTLNRFDGIDSFLRASYVFAGSCVHPPLGPMVEARNREGAKLPDSPSLVRLIFRNSPGVVFRVEAIIRKHSRMAEDDDMAAREVEAGKTSS